ncbi:MAG: hypothetical protein KAR20_14500 [Candidatus Heimdallarchaeota archaeon]|nr:hypothetical protein [Candidatus Heimdallarchaeota archaeon]
MHLILNASHNETEYMGKKILPGQIPTGRKALSSILGMSESQIRTVLKNLKSTGEITIKRYSKFSVISITNWDKYQFDRQHDDICVTNTSQSLRHQIATTKNVKNVKNNNYQLEEKLIKSWNSLGIMNHKISDSNLLKVRKKLLARMKNYSLDEILEAMKNYQEAMNLGWFSYKWPLWDFLSRQNANKFYPDEYVKENYINKNNEQRKLNSMRERENPYAN